MPTSDDHTIPAPSLVLNLNDAQQNDLQGF
jgi:hypothetical protein